MTVQPPSKRPKCNKCGYPQSTCLCNWVKVIQSPIKIVVLQHPKEARHPKNTVRLLKMSLTNLEVIQGENVEDFAAFSKQVADSPNKYILCYPNKHSMAIETQEEQPKHIKAKHFSGTVILIDASWRKALKMWHLNPWLHSLNSWHFTAPPNNQYQIRKTTQQNSLSTLESVAYLLNLTHNVDCTALYLLFEQMQTECFLAHKQR